LEKFFVLAADYKGNSIRNVLVAYSYFHDLKLPVEVITREEFIKDYIDKKIKVRTQIHYVNFSPLFSETHIRTEFFGGLPLAATQQ